MSYTPFPYPGVTSAGKNLAFQYNLARATDPTRPVPFPVVPTTMRVTDKQTLGDQQNLGGGWRRSYLDYLAPGVTFGFEGITRAQVDELRAWFMHGTDLYLFQPFLHEHFKAWDSIVYQVSGPSFCTMPPSSYRRASAIAVASGGTTLFESLQGWVTWEDGITEVKHSIFTPFITPTAYDDATGVISLPAVVGLPGDGERIWLSFDALGWLVRLMPPFSWEPVSQRSDRFNASVAFEGA